MRFAIASCAILSLTACAAPPQAFSFADTPLADRWLAVIEEGDWDGMAALLDEHAIYDDPTMAYFGEGPVHLEGREDIVEFWRESDEVSGTEYLRYDRLRCFTADNVIVINAHLNIEVEGEFWNINRAMIPLNSAQTTILTTKDGLIIHVTDYFDYADAIKQVDAHRDRYGELPKSQQASE